MVEKMGVAAFGIRDDDDDDDEGVSPNITNNNNQLCHILTQPSERVFFWHLKERLVRAVKGAHGAPTIEVATLTDQLDEPRPVAGGKLSVWLVGFIP